MIKRPNPQESEEDLLKLQQQFLSSHASSSARFKRPDKRKTEHDKGDFEITPMEGVENSVPGSTVPTKKSKVKFSEDVSRQRSSQKEDEDLEEMMDKQDRGLAAVLTTIIERDTRNEVYIAPVAGRQAFPSAVSMDLPIKDNKTKLQTEQPRAKRKSLFAQQVEAHSVKYFGVEPTPPKPVLENKSSAADDKVLQVKIADIPGPCFNYGAGLSASRIDLEPQKIHEENLQKLSSMSEQDILEEQQKLIQTLDPKLVEFLKARRKDKVQQMNASRDATTKEKTFSVKRENKKQQKNSGSPTSKEELPFKPQGTWLNMSNVEREKLEWMKDLPAPCSTSAETGRPARFDFQGNLMAVDADVPVNLGLHHHGDEPERAGYTLEEIFQLSRSSNLQQRSLALHTLARVISNAKSGHLTDRINSPILPSILDGGVVILLRWALDDNVPSAVAAAVNSLHALLYSPLDEKGKDLIWPWFNGYLLPTLTPAATLEKESQPEDMDEENKEEETDADVIKRDVVLALVTRMELLTRFNYLLDKMQLQPETIIQILEILQRIAQHSGTMAYEIFKCPGLMDKIIQEFLPTAWSVADPAQPLPSVYGVPLPAALRLIRLMCQSGRNLASILDSRYHLNLIVLRFLAVCARDLQLPKVESINLQTEALALWRVYATYGISTSIYFDLYSNVVSMISRLEITWSSAVDRDSLTYEIGLISVLEKLVCLAGCSPPDINLFNLDSSQAEVSFSPSLNWSHVMSLHPPIVSLSRSLLKDIGSNYPVQKQDLNLATVCLNFLATFYETEAKQRGLDEVSRLDSIRDYCCASLSPFLSSFGLSIIINNLCSHSNLLIEGGGAPMSEASPNLTSLGVFNVPANEGQTWKLNVPLLLPHSPFGFFTSLLRLCLALCRRNKDMIQFLLPSIVQNKDILLYMKKTVSAGKSNVSMSHFTQPENMFQFYWLKCCCLMPCLEMDVAHRVALRLLSRLHFGDEHLAHDLLSTVIFSTLFISEGEEVTLTSQSLTNLKLSETLHLRSATQEDINVSQGQLLQETFKSLNQIRGQYLTSFSGMEKAVQSSRNIYLGNSADILSLLVRNPEESLMPKDWVFMPLIHVYNNIANMGAKVDKNVSPQTVARVTSVLKWIYAVEIWRPAEMDSMSVSLRLSRIYCAFIAGSDLFLEKPVHHYLAGLLRVLTSHKLIHKMDLEEKIPGITSFYDLFQEVLDHYEADSFGDPVFAQYVLLPLQQKHSPLLRRGIWEERRKMLRTLRVPLEELLIPVENFLYPEETDHRLLQLYSVALATKAVVPTWSPVMYLVAVHHLNRFLYVSHDDGNLALRHNLWAQILAHRVQVSDVIYYQQYNSGSKYGLQLYGQLPASRQNMVDQQMNIIHAQPGKY
ncbi:RPAP1 [Biomphalaria pfeifferi]|uniref:RPAP1 n=1 Tax=Biomphalaria pfeifferi TaxID=112525 RepID=A0AAD8EWX5_BIOPF|nr:RPAP1 [Biomphalaria pfeifferi]